MDTECKACGRAYDACIKNRAEGSFHVLVELCGWDGVDPFQQAPDARLEYAQHRTEAGLSLFKAKRFRLALERFRRSANLLSVGLCCSRDHETAFESKNRSQAQELRRRCWLNAA
eukprot:6080559-Amphidinium_carterae.1